MIADSTCDILWEASRETNQSGTVLFCKNNIFMRSIPIGPIEVYAVLYMLASKLLVLS